MMIVNSKEELATSASVVADLQPVSKALTEGTLSVGEWDYRVRISHNDDRRWWVRVQLADEIKDPKEREYMFIEVARRGMVFEEWRPLCVDATDGELSYTTTLSCDMSTEALDRFLTAARDFIERHHGELDQILDDARRHAHGGRSI